jgi:hypothetical protein
MLTALRALMGLCACVYVFMYVCVRAHACMHARMYACMLSRTASTWQHIRTNVYPHLTSKLVPMHMHLGASKIHVICMDHFRNVALTNISKQKDTTVFSTSISFASMFLRACCDHAHGGHDVTRLNRFWFHHVNRYTIGPRCDIMSVRCLSDVRALWILMP